MRETMTALPYQPKDRSKHESHNVAFLIHGIKSSSDDFQNNVDSRRTWESSAEKKEACSIPIRDHIPKTRYLDDQEMSLSSKMELFYFKSENNFGCVPDEQLHDCNKSNLYLVASSSISSSKEDVTGSDSLLMNHRHESSVEKLRFTEPKALSSPRPSFEPSSANDFEQNFDRESNNADLQSSSSSSRLSKRASLEVSLPPSSSDRINVPGPNNVDLGDNPHGSDALSTSSLLRSNLDTLNCPSLTSHDSSVNFCFDNLENDEDSGSESDSERSSEASSSSSRNLQDEIDKRIEEGQKSGSLNFSNMRLPFFPSALLSVDVSKINRLNLHDNQLVSLPGSALSQLSSLTWLDLRFNRIKSLPKEIGHLKLLQVLLLQGNDIEHLPIQLGNLSQLKTLQFADNPIKYPPRNITNGGLEVILKYLSAISKRKRTIPNFRLGSETSIKSSVSKRNCGETSSILSSKPTEVKTLIEIDNHDRDFSSQSEPSIAYPTNKSNTDLSSEFEDSRTQSKTSFSNSNLDEPIEDPAIALDNVVSGNSAKTEDDVASSIASTANDFINNSLNSSDDECDCSNPITKYRETKDWHQKTSANDKTGIEDLIGPESQGSKMDEKCVRQTKRLCEKLKEESLSEIRRKSLHLILQNTGSDGEEEAQIHRCLNCRGKITSDHGSPVLQTSEVAQVPVTEMFIPELPDHQEPKQMKRKKKSTHAKSSKLYKPKLITAKKVEKRIRQDREEMQRTTEAASELRKIQRLRSKLGLQSWREDTKLRQEAFSQNFSEHDFTPPFAEAPFAIDEKLLPPRLRPKTPTFTRLNERQRKLSSIECDIKECLRKLGAQEKLLSGEPPSDNKLEPSTGSNGGSVKNKRVQRKTNMHGSSSNETTAVLNQLHSLRRQIQRLKLNAFI